MSDNKQVDVSNNELTKTKVNQGECLNIKKIMENSIEKCQRISCMAKMDHLVVGLRQQNFKRGGGGGLL